MGELNGPGPPPHDTRRTLLRIGKVAIVAAVLTACFHVVILEVRLHVLGRLSFTWTDFPWMAPIAYALYFLALGVVLAVPAWWRPERFDLPLLAGIYGGVGAFSLLLLYKRIHPIAFVVLAAAIGVEIARRVARNPSRASRMASVAAGIALALLGVLVINRRLWPLLAEARAVAGARVAPSDAPNILLLILDTVRAANLSAYGYHRPTTPALEALARDGVLFEAAFATESWTLPSHASMLTGLWAAETGASYLTPLHPRHPTLPRILREAGYLTGSFAGNSGWASAEVGIGRDFQHVESYDLSPKHLLWSTSFSQMRLAQELIGGTVSLDGGRIARALGEFELRPLAPRGPGMPVAPDVARRFARWRDRVGDRHPWFAMLNFFDAHGPYASPLTERFNGGRTAMDRYDGAIAYVDSIVGEVIDGLRKRGELERTIVLVTSDHGELFGEHGYEGHGTTLYLPVVHVPLLVRYPLRLGAAARRSDAVSLRDLAATILDLADVSAGHRLPGMSLFDVTRPEATSPMFLRAVRGINTPAGWPNAHGDLFGVITDQWHYIRYPDGKEELFAWRRDADERVNLADSASMHEVLDDLRRHVAGSPRAAKRPSR
jgi:arylsulfatase A-like enzyme